MSTFFNKKVHEHVQKLNVDSRLITCLNKIFDTRKLLLTKHYMKSNHMGDKIFVSTNLYNFL